MKSYKSGMTLLEVIASMFIICIGLLSVLMVIPYGAYQVSKARNAEFTSNMLAAGAEDLQIGEWNKNITNREGIGKPEFPLSVNSKIHVIDSFVTAHNLNIIDNSNLSDIVDYNDYFAPLDSTIPQEKMRGKDDLDYVLNETKRTEIKNQQGSGQYTYFVTLKPRDIKSKRFVGIDSNYNIQTYEEISEITFTTDLLGCYQRVNTDTAFAILKSEIIDLDLYVKAATFKLSANSPKLDFSTTKYVFLIWTSPTWTASYNHSTLGGRQTATLRRGEWCRVVNASTDETGEQTIIVISNDIASIKNSERTENNLPGAGVSIFIFPGVLYHKRIFD